jgi:predicted nuclease with TOPRIM domain
MENLKTENERNHAIDVALKQCDEIAELRQWKIDKNNELAVLRVENVEQQDKIKSLESEKEALQKRVREGQEYWQIADEKCQSLQKEVERLKEVLKVVFNEDYNNLCKYGVSALQETTSRMIKEALNP